MSFCVLEEPEVVRPAVRDVALLIATDFDGTIAPVVPAPEWAEIHPEAKCVLSRLASMPGVAVAIISGRDVEDVRRRTVGIRGLAAGSHGLECVDVNGSTIWTPRRQRPGLDEDLLASLIAAGLRVETKRCSVAVHFRGIDPSLATDAMSRFALWARRHDLDIMPGRKVIEARIHGGGKHAALRAISRRVRARRIVYAGDDTTDFAALGYAAEHGRGIFVESEECGAPPDPAIERVRSIESLCKLFKAEASLNIRPDAAATPCQ